VVASTNNAAVENVTKELPNAKKVDRRYLDGLGLFVPTAGALLAQSPDEDEPDEEDEDGDDEEAPDPDARAWGLSTAGCVSSKAATEISPL
jgi:hypothetical protein